MIRLREGPIARTGGASAGAPSVRTRIATAAAHLVELLLLFRSEDLTELFTDVGIKLVELPALVIRQPEPVPRERGKN